VCHGEAAQLAPPPASASATRTHDRVHDARTMTSLNDYSKWRNFGDDDSDDERPRGMPRVTRLRLVVVSRYRLFVLGRRAPAAAELRRLLVVV